MINILIINGPNLNLLGKRNPKIYGNTSFEDYYKELRLKYPDCFLKYYQSNSEGKLLEWLQDFGFRKNWGIVFNPAAYTHTSVAIADCVEVIDSPIVEVHISDIMNREDFRKKSYIRPYVNHHIIGKGLSGYDEAIDYLIKNLPKR